jgi:TPP-dependent pyruvate/acetoin dehydrogenase alpha subunit
LNMASLYGVPAVFVCENNLYAASTSIKRATKIENIADRAAAYGMRGDIADGMKVLDVYEHALEAVERARGGGGPTLLELKAFRLCGHSRRDPNNYMSEEEKALWQSKDPIPGFEKLLLGEGLLTAEEVKGLKGEVEASVDRAIEAGQKAKEPEASALYEGLYVNMEVPR